MVGPEAYNSVDALVAPFVGLAFEYPLRHPFDDPCPQYERTGMISAIRDSLKKYMSGKLFMVQIAAGCGSLAGRSLAVYAVIDQSTWYIVLASLLGSSVGYVGVYSLGYWLAFRKDYRESGRFMPLDIGRLQFVEQLPNLATVVVSVLTQGALIGATDLSPLLAANIGGSLSPHKIINVVTMLTSNSLKKAWVDGSWKPAQVLLSPVRALLRLRGREPLPATEEAVP
jgi:hypothetical protein